MISHGFVQRKDEEEAELYSLSPQGLDAYHRLVAWIRETMKGMRIWCRTRSGGRHEHGRL